MGICKAQNAKALASWLKNGMYLTRSINDTNRIIILAQIISYPEINFTHSFIKRTSAKLMCNLSSMYVKYTYTIHIMFLIER